MIKSHSMCRMAVLLWAAALVGTSNVLADDTDGLPLPTPTVRLYVPDISGKWTTESGGEFAIEQMDDAVKLRSGSGRIYEGKLIGHLVRLRHVYSSPADVPDTVPADLRPLFVGIELRFEGEVSPDRKSITAEVIDYDIQPDVEHKTIKSRTEVRTPLKLRRPIPIPQLAAVLVPYDQLAYRNGVPVFGHPSGNGPSSRLLLVVGRDLPIEWADAKLESSDPTIKYWALKLANDPSDRYSNELADALHEVLLRLDEKSREAVIGMDKMLVRAEFTREVLPGNKTLTLNKVDGPWKLQFGDTKGELHFVRATDEVSVEDTDHIFVPETVSVELRTGVALKVEQFRLVAQQNGAQAAVGDDGSLIATPLPPLSADGSAKVYRYRTKPIQVSETGRPSVSVPGALQWSAKPDDKLLVKLADEDLLQSDQVPRSLFSSAPANARSYPVAEAVCLRTPANLGVLWKEALSTAAACAGTPVDDFAHLSQEKAAEITNRILFTTDDLAQRVLTHNPFYERKLIVQIRDHAAMLLLRDEFLRMMQEQAEQLPALGDDATLRGFRRMIEPYASNPAFPLSHIRVSPPPSGGCAAASFDDMITSPVLTARGQHDCPFSFAFNDYFMEKAFGADRLAADRWSLNAVKEGLDRYRAAVNQTITKSRSIDRCDVKELLKLTGYDFDPVVGRLLPKLVRLDEQNGAMQWVPDGPARGAVANLNILADAVRAQKDYADLDTQAIIMAAGVVAMVPALISGAPLVALLTAAANVSVAAADAGLQIHEYIERQAELQRAKGASLVLGADRLTQAELQSTSLWQVALTLANLGLASTEVLGAVSEVSRANSVARGAELASQIERGGIKGLRSMSQADQRDVLAFIADSELARATKGEAALTDLQREGLNAGKVLSDDPLIAKQLAVLNGLDPAAMADPKIKRLVARNPDAVEQAHQVGAGEMGADGLRPAERGNYTWEQIRQKADILRDAGFDADETRFLMEEGVVGSAPPEFSIKGLGKKETQGWLREEDGTATKVGSPRARPGGAPMGWGDETMARQLLGGTGLENEAATAAQHAEGQAAMMMRNGKISRAWVDINNEYICWDCFTTLEVLLPPEGQLTVRFQEGEKSVLGWGPELAMKNGFVKVKNADGLAWWQKTFVGLPKPPVKPPAVRAP